MVKIYQQSSKQPIENLAPPWYTFRHANPNIIYILADDMGYGDIRHLNSDCAFSTPHLDRLAQEGMYFTDAHSSSAVCTPVATVSSLTVLLAYAVKEWRPRRNQPGTD